MDTFLERISNILSWAGVLCIVAGFGFGLAVAAAGGQIVFLIGSSIGGVGLWIAVGVVNYLICGDLRLTPWKEQES